MNGKSKQLLKGDEEGKNLIITLLGREPTFGFDVDSMYRTKEGWVIVELLKCDSVLPERSHPNRYWKQKLDGSSGNWRKFATLWALKTALNGRLFLLNYKVPYANFKLIEVFDMDPTEGGGITQDDAHVMTLDGTRRWYQALNSSAR